MYANRLRPLLAGLALGLFPPGPAVGQAGPAAVLELPAPGEAPWRQVRLRNVERETRYETGREDARPVLRAESHCGASMWVLPLEELQLDGLPWLAWRWRVERTPGAADERSRDGDDFAARVYAAFELDPEHTPVWQRLWHRVARGFYGDALPGSALVFVWSRELPRGTGWDSPYAERTRMQALASGGPGGWRTEWVDVPAAYRAAFGREPPPLRGLALMTDADDTCQEARAAYGEFRFAAAPPRAGRRGPGPQPGLEPRPPPRIQAWR